MLRRNAKEFTVKLRSLGKGEGLFAARAWLLAPVVEVSLALVGLKPTLRWIERSFPPRGGASERLPVARARALVDAVYRRHVVGGECLPRSLVQYALMRRAGSAVELVIGVAKDGASLDAHAWVRAEGSGESHPPFEPLLVSR